MNVKQQLEKSWNDLFNEISRTETQFGVWLLFLLVGSGTAAAYLPKYAPTPFAVGAAVWFTFTALVTGAWMNTDQREQQELITLLRDAYQKQVREDELAPLNNVLYRLYDQDGQLLYVGITSDVVARMAGHRADKWWWDEVADKRFDYYETRAELEAVERLSIIQEKPLYNIIHHPDRPTPTPRVKRRRAVRW